MPLPVPVSTPQVNRRRPPPIDGVDASYERMVAALSGAPIAMDGSSAATATSSSSSFAIPSVSVFSALGPSSSSSAVGGGVNSSSASNLLAVAASQNSSLTGSVAGGGGGGGTASSSAASSSPAVGGAGAGGPLGGNITAGSSSLSNNNSSSGGGGSGVGGSGGGNTTPTPSSTSSAAAAAAAANMIGGSPSATIAPTHYLQDALTDCVEHRLQHAVHYLRQYLRHQQILVMAEAAVGSSVPGAVTSIPMPMTMGSVSVPSVVSRLTGGGASTNVNTTNSSSSSVAPASSPSTNMSPQAAAAGGRGTSSSSGGRSVTYFDKLHRYLFQHDGARAVRSTFALFDAAFRHEQEQKIRRQLRDEEEGENESPSRQHRSSASLDTTAKTYSEAVQQGEKLFNRHQWTNAQRLTHRAALFSCFTDLFYISQRMSGQTYSPASEDSTIPSRLLFTFAATTLETHLLDVATPAVVLQCLVLVLSFMSLHVDLFSTSASTPTPAAGPHHRDTVALLTWIEQASAEKSAAMLRVLARHLEESLRCGPTTIATATTRKKRNQQQQQAQQQQIEQQQMMMLMMTSGGGGGAGQPVESVLQSPADERAKELLLSRIASACGLNSAVGCSSSNSTSGPSSSSSGVSSPFAPTRAATSNASPTTNPSSDVTGGANRQKRSFTLLDFDLVLEVVRLLIQMHTRVAVPMYSMLLSRCKPSFLSPPLVSPPQNSSTDKHVGAVTDSAASSSSTLGNLVLSLDDVQDTLKALSVIPGGVHAQLAEASRATTLMDEVVEHMHRVRRVLVQESVTGSGSMNHHQVGPTTAAASKPQQHGSSSSSSSSAKSSKHHHNHHHSNADGSDNGGGSATSGAASTVEDVFRRGTFLDRLPYTAASSSSTSTSALKQQGGAGLGGDHCVTLSYVSGRVLLGVMRALIPPTSPSGA